MPAEPMLSSAGASRSHCNPWRVVFLLPLASNCAETAVAAQVGHGLFEVACPNDNQFFGIDVLLERLSNIFRFEIGNAFLLFGAERKGSA